MKYRVGVTERYNLGNYEFAEITGEIEFTEEEADGDPAEYGLQQLDALLRPHRRRVERLVPEDGTSYVLDHPALEE
jgi:hypothetical protein